MQLGLTERELKELAQKSVQLILSPREGDSEALAQYKTSAEFRAGVHLACAAMVLVLAENNERLSQQLAALQEKGSLTLQEPSQKPAEESPAS
ncbi:hypothetical protein [Synechococcus sp. H60.2]|uniref:hypothetical protein n=1 Tax=unclassified Synechococcus TaxID=2626047 RepID=UPI0039C28A24